MRLLSLFLLLSLLWAPLVFGAEQETLEEYRMIIASRCTSCHEAGRIEQAMAEGRNVNEILNKMVQMGAEVTPRDKKVLGVFWGSPLKEKP
jgi:mono/diheme cytochrome c family protein